MIGSGWHPVVLLRGQDLCLHQLVGERWTVTALHPPGRAGAYGQGEVRWDSHPQTETVALLPSSCTFSPAGSLPCPRLPSSPSIPPALHPPGQPPGCRASLSGEGGTEPSGPPALGLSQALADLGPFLLDFQGHLGFPLPPVSLVSVPPMATFSGESPSSCSSSSARPERSNSGSGESNSARNRG